MSVPPGHCRSRRRSPPATDPSARVVPVPRRQAQPPKRLTVTRRRPQPVCLPTPPRRSFAPHGPDHLGITAAGFRPHPRRRATPRRPRRTGPAAGHQPVQLRRPPGPRRRRAAHPRALQGVAVADGLARHRVPPVVHGLFAGLRLPPPPPPPHTTPQPPPPPPPKKKNRHRAGAHVHPPAADPLLRRHRR